jgi:hypothetical protein
MMLGIILIAGLACGVPPEVRNHPEYDRAAAERFNATLKGNEATYEDWFEMMLYWDKKAKKRHAKRTRKPVRVEIEEPAVPKRKPLSRWMTDDEYYQSFVGGA